MIKVSTSKAASWSLRFQKTFGAILAAVALVIVFLPALTPSTAHADAPIYSPGKALGEKKSVSGRVYLDRSGSRSYMEPTDKQGASDGDIGLGGAKVYAQWTDYNNRRQKGSLSPVYYTQGKADGTYVIQLPDWTDAFGTVHKWEATSGQTLRIWADNPDSSKYTLAFVEGDSTFGGPSDRYRGTWNGAVGANLAENYNIAFQERPQFDQMFPPKNTWKQSSREGGGGDVVGQVWYEEREALGNSEAVPTFRATYGEVKVPGVKVVGAYVQDEVARRLDQWKKDHNYKREEFRQAQRQIMKAYEAETGKSAIAETVYDTTDANGEYHLQFQGLWGNSYSAKGIMNAGTWGELVPEGANASWAKANLRSRHVNIEYMYVAPEIPDGVGGSLNNFRDNMYQDGVNWKPNATTGAVSNVENVNFALRLEGRDFHIETYDQTTNPAKPGDTAPTKATGFVPNNTYDIVWTDGDGKEVKTCTAQASNLGVVESCPLPVPADLNKDEIYTASIYPEKTRDRAMAKDSFAAKVTPEYKATTIDLDDTATVAAPINKENNTTPPADTTYAAAAAADVPASLLKGVDQTKVTVGAQPWAKVNSDGTIALNPTTGSVNPGSYLIPVKLTYGKGKDAFERVILAPVTVKEPDGDNDGVADSKDKCAGTPKDAKVDANGCSVAPSVGKVPDINGQVGKEITPVTVPVDNPGKAKLTACKAEGLPAGLTIALNKEGTACVISGTPSEEAKDQEVTVKVSYEPVDKTDQHKGGDVTGTGKATIGAESDGDNDGVADSKDKCAGTPKGAKVDKNGCSVAPTVGKVPDITGQVGKEITPVNVPVDNPGKAKLTACSAEGLPAGLAIA
ncbi:thrombospondin type 3 repeat-containing domain protein, partial [Varibaculum cambriense]